MDHLKLNVSGHVLIKDYDTGEILVNRRNAIHLENMSFAVASSLTNSLDINNAQGFIRDLAFGNGGVVVDSLGDVIYNSPRVSTTTDTLYNETYRKLVDLTEAEDPDNNTQVIHEGGTTYSDVIITCTLDYSEPAGQDALDDTADQEGDYVFDERGLVSQQGRLLTHLIFHPVQKSGNRKIQVVYTVRISAG